MAEKLCDKVAIIKEGKLIRSGTMEEVKGDDSLEQVFLELEGGRMLKLLLKKQLTEIFRSYFYDAKKNRARSKAGTARVYRAVCTVDGRCSGRACLRCCRYLSAIRCTRRRWTGCILRLMGLLAIFLGAFGSVFNTYAGLYLAKDNDLLLSMPIPVPVLMASRLLGVYLMGLMYSGVVHAPGGDRLLDRRCTPALRRSAGSMLLVLLVSIFVLTLSCAAGLGRGEDQP